MKWKVWNYDNDARVLLTVNLYDCSVLWVKIKPYLIKTDNRLKESFRSLFFWVYDLPNFQYNDRLGKKYRQRTAPKITSDAFVETIRLKWRFLPLGWLAWSDISEFAIHLYYIFYDFLYICVGFFKRRDLRAQRELSKTLPDLTSLKQFWWIQFFRFSIFEIIFEEIKFEKILVGNFQKCSSNIFSNLVFSKIISKIENRKNWIHQNCFKYAKFGRVLDNSAWPLRSRRLKNPTRYKGNTLKINENVLEIEAEMIFLYSGDNIPYRRFVTTLVQLAVLCNAYRPFLNVLQDWLIWQ